MIQDMDFYDKLEYCQARYQQCLKSSLKFQRLAQECAENLTRVEDKNFRLRDENQRLRNIIKSKEVTND